MNTRLRKQILTLRKQQSQNLIQNDSRCICDHILKSDIFFNAKNIMVYYPFNNEVNIKPIIECAWNNNKVVAFPKILKKHVMEFFCVTNYNQLSSGHLGIMEPIDSCPLFIPQTDTLMIVPGLAFCPTNNGIQRIGYGGGYYDYYLAKHKSKLISCAVAYDFQLCSKEKIHIASHDQMINFLITPTTKFLLEEYL